jgi:DNA mismatch repair ATPase MutS
MFRGTNAADRIAASADVLRYLASARDGNSTRGAGKAADRDRCLVLAATHDLELVGLLDGRFAPYHFGDRITDTGLEFDYLLHPGPTTSRNALALLRLLGAPPEIASGGVSNT